METAPDLSIIIASYNARRTIGACLDSLGRQETTRRFEVIVVDSSTDGTAEFVAAHFPEVRLLRFAGRKYPGAARNAGLAIASAPVVAFTDADCIAREDYVEALIDAHQNPVLAIGGVIANQEPANVFSWAAYLCELSEWMPGPAPGLAGNLATANASYKKYAFDKYGPFLEGTYGSDTDFNCRLLRDGHKLLWSPSIWVSHQSIGRFRIYLGHEFTHGRDCCRMWIRNQRYSRLRRCVYALCFWLIPAKLLLVIAARVVRKRTYLSPFLRLLPLIALGLIFWCCGELVGFLRPEHAPDRIQA